MFRKAYYGVGLLRDDNTQKATTTAMLSHIVYLGEERGEARGVPVNASCGRTVKCGSKG